MYLISITLSIVLVVCCLYLLTYLPDQIVQGQNATTPAPLLRDSDLKVELVAKHFNFPTAIDFWETMISYYKKNTGNVYEVIMVTLQTNTPHKRRSQDERGLLVFSSEMQKKF